MMMMNLFTLDYSHPLSSVDELNKTKGQLRVTKPKSSGAVQLKRAAKKRNNIRKHS